MIYSTSSSPTHQPSSSESSSSSSSSQLQQEPRQQQQHQHQQQKQQQQQQHHQQHQQHRQQQQQRQQHKPSASSQMLVNNNNDRVSIVTKRRPVVGDIISPSSSSIPHYNFNNNGGGILSSAPNSGRGRINNNNNDFNRNNSKNYYYYYNNDDDDDNIKIFSSFRFRFIADNVPPLSQIIKLLWISIFIWMITNIILYMEVSYRLESYYDVSYETSSLLSSSYNNNNNKPSSSSSSLWGGNSLKSSSSSFSSTKSLSDIIPLFDNLDTIRPKRLSTERTRYQIQKLIYNSRRNRSNSNNTIDDDDGQEKYRHLEFNLNDRNIIDMNQIRSTLKFDNIDGGVWKQGYELYPIFNESSLFNVTTTTTTTTTTTNTDSSSSKTKQPLLTIIVVPFTHIDPLSISTDKFTKLFINIINVLIMNNNRTFIFNDISLLETFYNTIATKIQKDRLKQLIYNKQFAISSLGYISTLDEAITTYNSYEISIQEGIMFINTTFGIDYIPKYIWSLGPSGYSSSINTDLYIKYGIKGIVLQHIHYNIRKYFAKHQFLEFYWKQVPITMMSSSTSTTKSVETITTNETSTTANSTSEKESRKLNNSAISSSNDEKNESDDDDDDDAIFFIKQRTTNTNPFWNNDMILTHVMPFYTYDIPHTCGPDPGICCQFDFELIRDEAYYKRNKFLCPWKKGDPIEINNDNVHERSMMLLDQYLKKASLYKNHNVLLIPLGGDSKYMLDADIQYRNYEKIFQYINDHIPSIHIQFGTLSTYFETIHKNLQTKKQNKQQQKEQQQQQKEQEQYVNKNDGIDVVSRDLNSSSNDTSNDDDEKFPVLVGSFFPYADRDDEYATNYYSQSLLYRSLGRRLERILYVAETLGVEISEVRLQRQMLVLFQHHDFVRTMKLSPSLNELENRVIRAIDDTNDWIVKKFTSLLTEDMNGQLSTDKTTELIYNMKYCGSYSDLFYMEPNYEFVCEKSNYEEVIVYNPSSYGQILCNDFVIESGQFIKVTDLPCDEELIFPAAATGNKIGTSKSNTTNTTTSESIMSELRFDNTTGLLMEPIQERWAGCMMDKGAGEGNYIPRDLNDINLNDEKIPITIDNGGYIVKTPTWKRTIIENEPITNSNMNFGIKATVIDFFYETNAATVPETIAVRFGSPNINNDDIFYTDLNGVAFEQHQYRRDIVDIPQSQIMPMSSMTFIQGDKTRMTVISDDGHGVSSSMDGFIDIYINRCLIGKIIHRDREIISTRLRVVIEEIDDSIENDEKNHPSSFMNNSTISSFVRRKWEEVQHPLEFYGRRLPSRNAVYNNEKSSTATSKGLGNVRPGVSGGGFRGVDTRASMLNVQLVNNSRYSRNNTMVPFVFMVYNRINYLEQTIQSLRDSDFPKMNVPIIISHDGHVPEMIEYVETIKKEFKVIQLFHPYSCYDHPDSFPGGNDTGLNIGYNGDSYGHERAARVTCAKHHFTWMIQKVFSLTHKEIFESIGEQHDQRLPPSLSIDTFFFTEEDYLLSPKIYDSIIAGLNAIDKYETNKDKNNGFFGLVFEPKSMNYRRNDYWYAGAFVSGPMTMNRHIFSKLQNNADKYCRFDDYNWDWSFVNMMNSEHVMPYIVLMPSQHLVKHIGIHGGMHSNKVKRVEVSTTFTGLQFAGSLYPLQNRIRRGFGGWGHPMDQNHCVQLLSTSTNEVKQKE